MSGSATGFRGGSLKIIDLVNVSLLVDINAWVGYRVLWGATDASRFATIEAGNNWRHGDSMWFQNVVESTGFFAFIQVATANSATLGGIADARIMLKQRTSSIVEIRYDATRNDYVPAGDYFTAGITSDGAP